MRLSIQSGRIEMDTPSFTAHPMRKRNQFTHKMWIGGDVPRRGICLRDSLFGRKWRGVRHQLFLHWLAYFMNVWGFPCGRYTRKRAWNQAGLDAWASIRHEA